MAGYIFNLNDENALKMYIENGVYATILKQQPNGRWKTYQESTFADYVTMKPGDNVYFFINRKIYGIGKLIEIEKDKAKDCKFLNFPEANNPSIYEYTSIKGQLLWDEGQNSPQQRWICLFKPYPYFFKKGIDMDDVLISSPERFKMLRAFWKLSFIKIDDDENQALMDIILRKNKHFLKNPPSDAIYTSQYNITHQNIQQKLGTNYILSHSKILESCAAPDGSLEHEMALEAGILAQLSIKDPSTVNIFGEWDYLSHQVIASPFKPIDYMDKMDIFGYSYIKDFPPTKSEFLVIENKKGTANAGDAEQIMKYVDWIKEEYASNDYSMIRAYLVAFDFNAELIKSVEEISSRRYIKGRRPPESEVWSNLNLVKYSFNHQTKKLDFFRI